MEEAGAPLPIALCVIERWPPRLPKAKPHELIDREIGCDVVEIYGDELEPLRRASTPLAERTEMRGETLFCYVREPGPLLAALHGNGSVRYLHRPANLEDVFLKLTGRDVEEP